MSYNKIYNCWIKNENTIPTDRGNMSLYSQANSYLNQVTTNNLAIGKNNTNYTLDVSGNVNIEYGSITLNGDTTTNKLTVQGDLIVYNTSLSGQLYNKASYIYVNDSINNIFFTLSGKINNSISVLTLSGYNTRLFVDEVNGLLKTQIAYQTLSGYTTRLFVDEVNGLLKTQIAYQTLSGYTTRLFVDEASNLLKTQIAYQTLSGYTTRLFVDEVSSLLKTQIAYQTLSGYTTRLFVDEASNILKTQIAYQTLSGYTTRLFVDEVNGLLKTQIAYQTLSGYTNRLLIDDIYSKINNISLSGSSNNSQINVLTYQIANLTLSGYTTRLFVDEASNLLKTQIAYQTLSGYTTRLFVDNQIYNLQYNTISSQLYNKANNVYVNDNFVYKTGQITESITGIKTFTGRVICTNVNIGTSNNDLINITYADTRYGQLGATNTWTQNNTFRGNLISNRNISTNLFMGSNSGIYRQSTSLRNTALGEETYRGNATTQANNIGTDNVCVGHNSLQLCEQGSFNVGIGVGALQNFRTSTLVVGGVSNLGRNTAIGYNALLNSADINRSIAIGYRAGASLVSNLTYQNTIIGHNAFSSATGGIGNTIIGSDVLGSTTLPQNSATVCGFNALGSATQYEQAVAFGSGAGQVNANAFNTYVGYAAGSGNTGQGNIFIGQTAGTIDAGGGWHGVCVIGGMNAKANRTSTLVLGGRCQLPTQNTTNEDGRYPNVCIPNKVLLQCCESLPATASVTMRNMVTTEAGAEYGETILITSNVTTSITLPFTAKCLGTGFSFPYFNYCNNDPNAKPASIGMSFYFVKAYTGALTSITITPPTGQLIYVEGKTTGQTEFIFDATMRVCSFTCINFITGNPYGNGVYWVLRSRDYTNYVKNDISNNLTALNTFTGGIIATETQTINFGLNAPFMSGANITGLTKSMVGLGNVDNTSDLGKPISTATQTALDLKAPINNPTFTGTVSGITKSMVGLGSVDNTSDLGKPISTATQSALDAKIPYNYAGLNSGVNRLDMYYDFRFYNLNFSQFYYWKHQVEGTGAYTLYNSQNNNGCFIGWGNQNWSANSDRRIKNNIVNIDIGIDIINKLRPVSFYFNGINDKKLGFIAQEVEEVIPEIVSTGGFNETLNDYVKGIETTSIIPVLVKAIQEQDKKLNDLQTQLNYITEILKSKIII